MGETNGVEISKVNQKKKEKVNQCEINKIKRKKVNQCDQSES